MGGFFLRVKRPAREGRHISIVPRSITGEALRIHGLYRDTLPLPSFPSSMHADNPI
jgi:hypothetical protein